MLANARRDTVVLTAAASLLALGFAGSFLVPQALALVVSGAVAGGAVFLAYQYPVGFSVAWLLVTSLSLEMTLHDLIGEGMLQSTIAALKGVGSLLAVLCALRCGPRMELANPVWAYAAMLAAGIAHGLHPGLTSSDSVRSFIGSAAPFAFCFCQLPRSWPDAIIRAAKWAPVFAVAASIPLAIADVRPMFVDSGGARLAGLGHPAFLAGVCLPAIYACLIQLFRLGRLGDIWLLAANFLILVLTGARAPLAYAIAVTGISLLTIRSRIFDARIRILMVLAGAFVLPLLLVFAGDLAEARLFNLMTHEAGNLSGRSLLWPAFEAAAGQSPWFGWGIGAGNVIIPSDSPVARLLHTWAAHNEYLRIEVEGGQIGRALLIALFTAWVINGTRHLPAPERRIMRLVFIAFAAHAVTDNVLISTPACVLIAFATAVFRQSCLPDSVPRA